MLPATGRIDRSFPHPSETLAILGDAIRPKDNAVTNRAIASDDPRSVDEGLAVLRCYVAIPDRRVRQAILDVLAAAIDPNATAEVQCDPCSWKPGAS